MKKTTVILIPIVLVILVIAGAFLFRAGEKNLKSSGETGVEVPNAYDTSVGQPGTGLGSMESAGSGTQGADAAVSEVSDLSKDLDATADDGGADELQGIKNQATGL